MKEVDHADSFVMIETRQTIISNRIPIFGFNEWRDQKKNSASPGATKKARTRLISVARNKTNIQSLLVVR